MKNREIIANINNLYALRKRESERNPKTIIGKPLLILSRNLRMLEEEYSDNYMLDLKALRERYYEKKEVEVTVPADEEKGIKEHTEKRAIESLNADMKKEDYDKELQELLDLDVDVPIMKVSVDLLGSVADAKDADALEFMTDYGAADC
jgi:hypothetical protein